MSYRKVLIAMIIVGKSWSGSFFDVIKYIEYNYIRDQ